MRSANEMQIFYYSLPIVVIISLWLMLNGSYANILFYYFWFYAVGEFFITLFFIRNGLNFGFLSNIRGWYATLKEFLIYGVSRIPSSLLLALIFGIPVVVASHRLSLVYAGYVGISISILRLMELLVVPIRILLLPRFAELVRNDSLDDVNYSIQVVLDFLFSFVSIIVAMFYGLSKYVVIVLFGVTYLPAVDGVYLVVLFSFLYLAFIVVRSVLDGLFFFPYVSVICLLGALTTGSLSFLFNSNYEMLVFDLGIGLSTIGVVSILVLLRKQKTKFNVKSMVTSLVVATLVFCVLLFFDTLISSFMLSSYIVLVIMLAFRVVLFIFLLMFLNKRGSLWFTEVRKRFKVEYNF